MENWLLLSPRDSDGAVLAASSQVATLPVANLQSIQPKKVWRAAGVEEWVSIDFGDAGMPATDLALVGHNLSTTATIRVRGKNSPNVTVSPAVDTGAVSAWPPTGKPAIEDWPNWLSWVRWPAAGTLRYWRLDIADPDNEEGYVEAGRFALGAALQTGFNINLESIPLGFDLSDIRTTTAYGSTFTDRRSATRRMELKLSAGDRSDVLAGIAEIQRLRGAWGDLVVALDPDETTDFHRFAMQALVTEKGPTFPVTKVFASDGGHLFSASLTLAEVL